MLIKQLNGLLSGNSLRARALRGSGLTLLNFGGAQFLRLLSNLILTRLLFPEVFGLMALVQVFMVGIEMFSDLGIRTSIIQNKRGDEPAFLNTAWTLQILRGILLWLITCAIANPVAQFYDAPMLGVLMPIVGLNGVLLGLQSTNMATANRKLMLGRLTALELGTTAFGLVITVLLAWWLQSVWALVYGGLISASTKMILSHLVLPGISNRLHWETAAFHALFNFGKYIFASSIAGFLLLNADRAILGKYISLSDLGIYNIAFFLASVPLLLVTNLGSRVMLPLYRERPPKEGAQNQQQIARARAGITAAVLGLSFCLGIAGNWLIMFLYDDRYVTAGPMLSLFAIALMPSVMLATYNNLFLALGLSRDFALLMVSTALCRVLMLWAGVHFLGIPGAMLAIFGSELLTYPLRLYYLRRHHGQDLKHDALFSGVICLFAAIIIWANFDAIHAILGSAL